MRCLIVEQQEHFSKISNHDYKDLDFGCIFLNCLNFYMNLNNLSRCNGEIVKLTIRAGHAL